MVPWENAINFESLTGCTNNLPMKAAGFVQEASLHFLEVLCLLGVKHYQANLRTKQVPDTSIGNFGYCWLELAPLSFPKSPNMAVRHTISCMGAIQQSCGVHLMTES